MENPEWEPIKTIGKDQPKPICNHSTVIFGEKMYLYGGSCPSQDKPTFYTLDLSRQYKWEVVKAKPKDDDEENLPHCYATNEMGQTNYTPTTHDEHSCILYGDSMIVFGGFTVDGVRTNDIF